MKRILVGFFLMGFALLAIGCLWPRHAYVRGDEGPVVEFGYRPVLYSGYVVYYADGGMPFVWMNGSQFWIPAAERSYYVSHYQQHGRSYHTWYRHRGDSYRNRRYSNRKGDRRHQKKRPHKEKRHDKRGD